MGSEVRFFWEDPIDVLLIKAAWEKAFKKKVTDAYWKDLWNWRFVNNPLADRTDAAYIMSGDDVASFVAFSPLYIRQGNTRIKAALGNIGFTHPDHQGKGLYSRMYNALIDKMISEKYQMLIGFDNHNSHYPEVKHLQWSDIAVLNSFSLRLQELSSSQGPGFEEKIENKPLDELALRRMCAVWQSKGKIHVERSLPYLKWRLLDNPRNRYRAMMFTNSSTELNVIYKVFAATEIDIMEMISPNPEADASVLVIGCFDEFRRLGFEQVNLWSNLFSSEHLALEKIGFKESGFSTYFVYRDLSGSSNFSSYRDWHIRFLDSDVY